MFNIRTEKDYTIRTYTASSYFDAIDLFYNLAKVLPFVQLWQGDKLLMAYEIDWAKQAEKYIHNSPFA
jgi:hypothetical protein